MSSSDGVTVFWLDGPRAVARVREAVSAMARRVPELEEAWLFGSLARGDYSRRSDADVLLVLSESEERPTDRIPCLLEEVLELDIPVDIFPLTRDEIARRLSEGDPFLLRVERERVLLWRRGADPAGGVE